MIKYDYDTTKNKPDNFWLVDYGSGYEDYSPEEYGVTFESGLLTMGHIHAPDFYLSDEEARELAHGILKVLGDE